MRLFTSFRLVCGNCYQSVGGIYGHIVGICTLYSRGVPGLRLGPSRGRGQMVSCDCPVMGLLARGSSSDETLLLPNCCALNLAEVELATCEMKDCIRCSHKITKGNWRHITRFAITGRFLTFLFIACYLFSLYELPYFRCSR